MKKKKFNQTSVGMQSLAQRTQQQKQQRLEEQQRAKEEARKKKTEEEQEQLRHVPQQNTTYYGKSLDIITPPKKETSFQSTISTPPITPTQNTTMKQAKRKPEDTAPLKPMEFYQHFSIDIPIDTTPAQERITPVTEQPTVSRSVPSVQERIAPVTEQPTVSRSVPSVQERIAPVTEQPTVSRSVPSAQERIAPVTEQPTVSRSVPPVQKRTIPVEPQKMRPAHTVKIHPVRKTIPKKISASENKINHTANIPKMKPIQTNLPSKQPENTQKKSLTTELISPTISTIKKSMLQTENSTSESHSSNTISMPKNTANTEKTNQTESKFKKLLHGIFLSETPAQDIHTESDSQKAIPSPSIQLQKESVSQKTIPTSPIQPQKEPVSQENIPTQQKITSTPSTQSSQKESVTETPLQSAAFYQRFFSDFKEEAPPKPPTEKEIAQQQHKQKIIDSVKDAVSTSTPKRRRLSKREQMQKKAEQITTTAAISIICGVSCVIAGFLLIAPRNTVSYKKQIEMPQYSWQNLWDGSYTKGIANYYDNTIPCRDALQKAISDMVSWIEIQQQDNIVSDANQTNENSVGNNLLP